MKNKVVCNSIGSTSVCGECPFGRFHEKKDIAKICKTNESAVIIAAPRYVEIFCATVLKRCRYLPGCFDKSFVSKINTEPNYTMSEKGRNFMFSLLHKYRKQIGNYQKVRKMCIDYFQHDPENISK